MAREINTAAIYEEKRHSTPDTHTQIKLEGWALAQSTSIYQ